MDGEEKRRRGNPQWQKGQSGNPKGRAIGARSVLSESFLRALQADFEAHGVRTIAKVRRYKPDEYLKLIARIIPQKVDVGGAVEVSVSAKRDAIQRKLNSLAPYCGEDDLAEQPVAGRA